MAAHELRLDEDPAVGDRVVGIEDLDRRYGVDLSDRQRHLVARVPVRGVDEQSRRLAGEIEVGQMAESESLDLGEDPSLAHASTYLVGADVRRQREDLGRAQVLERVGLSIVEVPSANGDGVRHCEHARGSDEARLQRRREGDDLEDRAGLVVLAERQVVDRLVDARDPH